MKDCIKQNNQYYSNKRDTPQLAAGSFIPSTIIKFDIPTNNPPFTKGGQGGFVTLKIYDITGKEIATSVNEDLKPGSYEVTFNGINLSTGIYFYKLTTKNFIETKKLVLIK